MIYLEPEQWTPAPWINVVANPDFGFMVSETGAGYTWFGNSGENRLTPWSNDPVTDPPGEAIYLRDEETAEVWSPTPLPCRAAAPYLVRHGAGYTVFEHHSHGLAQRLRLFAASTRRSRWCSCAWRTLWAHPRRITATFYAEWVLGVTRDTAQQYVVPEYDSEHRRCWRAIPTARIRRARRVRRRQPAAPRPDGGSHRVSGPQGKLRQPAALGRIGLASVVEPGLDPCAALQLHIDLQPGEAKRSFSCSARARIEQTPCN